MAEAGTGSLLRSEDWISVWMGTAIIALVVVGVRLQGAGPVMQRRHRYDILVAI